MTWRTDNNLTKESPRIPEPPALSDAPEYSAERRLYHWAKEIWKTLNGEPRHEKLEYVYKELGAAIKNFEAEDEFSGYRNKGEEEG